MTLFTLLFSLNSMGQIYDPVDLTTSIEYLGNNEVVVVMKMEIEDKWHGYGLDASKEDGPLPTLFNIKDSAGFYQKSGKPYSPSELHVAFEPAFGIDIGSYENEAIFKQKVTLLKDVSEIKGEFEYMVCKSETCLPPAWDEFEWEIKKGYFEKKTIGEGSKEETSKTFGPWETPDDAGDSEPMEGGMLDPLSWNFSAESIGDNLVLITAKPILDEGWHLYADLGSDLPIPTTFWLNEEHSKDKYSMVGKVFSKPAVDKKDIFFDEAFKVDVAYLPHDAVLQMKVQLGAALNLLKGELEFQTCDDERCLPPTLVDFAVDVKPEWFDPAKATTVSADATGDDNAEGDDDNLETASWWSIFFKGFGGGLIALLTPCVFPMIPMTVNFFIKQSSNRSKGISNAVLYGLSIIGIYTAIGFILTKALGPDVMNQMASNGVMNMIFFLVFVLFGMSFLGAFEISLPSSIVNKSDKQADKGGLLGIFFMAFTLAVVSFSCTGPIIGSLLVLAAQGGDSAGPIAGMLGFSSALALPFTLFAIFPSWLANMPKSGGWLNSVKVVLGLVELALAMKFLSNVDLAYHWGVVNREIFISTWVVIFAVIGFYLIGKLKFSHDSDLPYISVPRIVMAIFAFGFSVYLLPGLFGAPLKLMSGLAPPRSYVEDVRWMRRGMNNSVVQASGEKALSTGDHCPNGLACTKDYEEGLAYAKEHNKPIFLDFTGYTCVNCRKMEDNIWVDPRIDEILRNDYVVISLYVDDKKKLPKAEQGEKDLFGKTFKQRTVGDKWTYMEASRYGSNSQPFYVLLGPDEEMLTEKPIGYTPDVEDYEAYLKKGVEAFNKKY